MKVTFYPTEIQKDSIYGETLLQVAQRSALLTDASCGGQGTCGKCKIKILSGEAGTPDLVEKRALSESELQDGWRLACRIKLDDNLTILLPEQHDVARRKESLLWLPEGFRPDTKEFDGGEEEYGIAFDIGTTTVVGMLWNLTDGELIGAASRSNPQSAYGADVISRILFCNQNTDNLELMQQLIIDCANAIARELFEKHKITSNLVVKGTFVGNTTMSHILLAMDPSSLAVAPFQPAYRGPIQKKAVDLGLEFHPQADIFILANIAGHVGSDITGVLLSTELKDRKGANLAVDIGTNGEILLALEEKVLTCSTAAGPAFEGASIRHGMRAAHGAIERIYIQDDDLELSVIGEDAPIGICGSGLIDGVALLLKHGFLSNTGKLFDREEAKGMGLLPKLMDRIRNGDQGREFVLSFGNDTSSDVVITQKDIREVQLAKGAIAAGINILMGELKINIDQLDQILLAGAFGNYIDKRSALIIGLLPPISEEKVISVGNAAGVGSSMALLSDNAFRLSTRLSSMTEYVDLASHPSFQEQFLKGMYF